MKESDTNDQIVCICHWNRITRTAAMATNGIPVTET